MSVYGDEQLDYLELFHFVVCIIGEDVNFLGMFKTGLAKLLRNRVARCISESDDPLTELTETKFVNSTTYQKLVSTISAQLHAIVSDIRQEKCWVPQGAGSHGDPVDSISKVLDCANYGVEELRILRGIAVDKLTFMPELTLYYEALFRATMSDNKFVRCFSYALIRTAPSIFDSRHFFTILNEALKIWTSRAVTFEFAAALALVLNALCDIIGTVLEDELQELLYQLIEGIPKSQNFSMLMVLDPSLRWITKSLPIASLRRVLSVSLEQLRGGSWAHVCLICRAVTKGIFGFEMLTQALEIAVPHVNAWTIPIKRETRMLLASLVSRLPHGIVTNILGLLANALKDETMNQSLVFVFSEFVVINYLKTTAPFHEELFNSLSSMIVKGNRSKDIDRMFAAICGNPVRFLRAIQKAPNVKIFETIRDCHQVHTSLYHVLFAPSESPLLSSDKLTLLVGAFLEHAVMRDEIDEMSQGLEHLALGLNACIYPSAIGDLISFVETTADEEMKAKIIQIVYVIALSGRDPKVVRDIRCRLPTVSFVCEYSQFLEGIDQCMAKSPSMYELVRAKLAPSAQHITTVGSRILIQLAIMFQIVICHEANSTMVAFHRSRISSPEWFTFACLSLFTTLWKDPLAVADVMMPLVSESPYYLVWFALRMALKISEKWTDALADEHFDDLFALVLCPQIDGTLDKDDIEAAKMLHKKYKNVVPEIEAILARNLGS